VRVDNTTSSVLINVRSVDTRGRFN
jgi:hypothetical protein